MDAIIPTPLPQGQTAEGMHGGVQSALSPAKVAYLGFLARYHGNTYTIYRYHLDRYLDWCESRDLDPLADVTRTHVELYVRELVEAGYKASTIGTAMSPVKGYYRFAVIDDLIVRNPAEYVRLPTIHYPPKAPVEQVDLLQFLRVAKDTSPRHWAMTHLLCHMGLRISEACALDVSSYQDVEQGQQVLKFIGKGGRPAAVPIPLTVLRALEAVTDGRTAGPLIPSRSGQRLSRGGGSGLITTVNRRAGLKRHINPHLLRAAAITQGFDSNLSTRDVQHFARHADPRTTSTRYDLGQNNHGRHAVHVIAARLSV